MADRTELSHACRLLLVLNIHGCTQEAGEAIFVPSGWHHTVHNLADTLSVNANWLNAFNAHWAGALLRRERAQAAAAIEDCRCAEGLAQACWLLSRERHRLYSSEDRHLAGVGMSSLGVQADMQAWHVQGDLLQCCGV